jgi:hypothetical protein
MVDKPFLKLSIFIEEDPKEYLNDPSSRIVFTSRDITKDGQIRLH